LTFYIFAGLELEAGTMKILFAGSEPVATIWAPLVYAYTTSQRTGPTLVETLYNRQRILHRLYACVGG
jgi:hypothetical protein